MLYIQDPINLDLMKKSTVKMISASPTFILLSLASPYYPIPHPEVSIINKFYSFYETLLYNSFSV